MNANEYNERFIDLALRNAKRLAGKKDETVQSEIAALMSAFVTDVVTGNVTHQEFTYFSTEPNVIRYYAPYLDTPDDDYIEVLLDNIVVESITCPVKDLRSNPDLEEFIIKYVGCSYLDSYKKIFMPTCAFSSDVYRYVITSCPTDIVSLYIANLADDSTEKHLKDVDFDDLFILRISNHFEHICPIESAKLRGIALYVDKERVIHQALSHMAHSMEKVQEKRVAARI